MIAAVIAFPLVALTLTVLLPNRAVRSAARFAVSALALLATIAVAPSLPWLSAIFAVMVSLLSALATLFSTGILPPAGNSAAEPWSRKPAYFILLGGFWSSMLLAVMSDGFIGLWIGISATTLATTFLVAYTGGQAALEAAWKYLILCSFGIAIALIGMLFLGRAAIDAGIAPAHALAWDVLAAHAAQLNVPLTRVALTLMLVGFATKAGLVPMHAWLPDAHSKAPAPVSALLSGLLVSCALYALVRVQTVAAQTPSASLFDAMLSYVGVASIVIAALFMLAQRDVKRLLSYSTVEHAGIVALALGLATPLAAFAALYHILNHAFAKSGAFLSIGIIQEEQGTTTIGHLHGLWNVRGGRPFLAALVGLAGLPPFGLFLSELLVVIAAIQAHAWLLLALALTGWSIAFAALLRLAIVTESDKPAPSRSRTPRSMIALASGAVACVTSAALVLALMPFVPWSREIFALLATIFVKR
ncbi:MAG: proton-conducting transporter membrane subunit [Candidatus Velthaea sp.]|jgi:hydrogenase-4 component F